MIKNIKKLFFTITMLILLTACTSNSSETVSREELQTIQRAINAQATQLALLMATPTTTPTAMPTATPTQTASQPAAPEVQPTPPAHPPAQTCTVIHDYQLKDLIEVATSEGNYLHVEYWVGGDAPEYETILPGGRYLLKIQFSGGHVWEYGPGCDFDQVMEEVKAHIARRIAQKAKNGGYVNWKPTGYFIPVQ
jgi:hypothetical protein